MKLYFTPTGAQRFLDRMNAVQEELRSVQSQKGIAIDRGGCWHDNAEFEELVRKEAALGHRVEQLLGIRNRMTLVEGAPESCDLLRIGHIADIDVDGEFQSVQIGGYEDSDPAATPPIVSYLAPLVAQLIGEAPGKEATATVGRKHRRVTLVAISLPDKKGG